MAMWYLLKVLLYGWLILMVAILMNIVARCLGIQTWYDYMGSMGELGLWRATLSLRLQDSLFLFFIYPGIFGLILSFIKR